MGVPWLPKVRRASLISHVLKVFGQREWAGFEDQDAAAVRSIRKQQRRSNRSSKGSAADYDHIKIPPLSSDLSCGTINGFLQRVAKKSPHVVESKGSLF